MLFICSGNLLPFKTQCFAMRLAESCHSSGKSLPKAWQGSATTMAKPFYRSSDIELSAWSRSDMPNKNPGYR